jgi:hypothetical protein
VLQLRPCRVLTSATIAPMGHQTEDELQRAIRNAKEEVEVGGIYYHYKTPDKYYVVESIGFLESSEEICVVYRALYDKGIVWVRTLENFTEMVGGNLMWKKRFMKVDPSDE